MLTLLPSERFNYDAVERTPYDLQPDHRLRRELRELPRYDEVGEEPGVVEDQGMEEVLVPDISFHSRVLMSQKTQRVLRYVT